MHEHMTIQYPCHTFTMPHIFQESVPAIETPNESSSSIKTFSMRVTRVYMRMTLERKSF